MISSPRFWVSVSCAVCTFAAVSVVSVAHTAPPTGAKTVSRPAALTGVPLLRGTVCFTIPWGERPGQLTFAPAERYRHGDDFSGPGGLAVDSGGTVYVYDRYKDRVSRYGKTGALEAMVRVPRPTTGDFFTLTGYVTANEHLWLGDSFGNLMYLTPQTLANAAATTASVAPGKEAPVTTVFKMGDLPKTQLRRMVASQKDIRYVEVAGYADDTPQVWFFRDGEYGRHINGIDLVSTGGPYDLSYILELDRDGKQLYRNARKELVVMELGPEGDTLRELAVALPQKPPVRNPKFPPDRWHLVGSARGTGADPILYFAAAEMHGTLLNGDTLYLVTPRRGPVARVAVSAPPGMVADNWLRHFRHLMTVTGNGDLYLGVPTEAGLAIVRYALPKDRAAPVRAERADKAR